jgi:predicted transcriptional regulator
MWNMENHKSPHFTPDEIINLPALAAKLKQEADPATKHIVSRLSEATRRLLDVYSGDKANGQALSTAVAADFATIIEGENIYVKERFANVPLSQKTVKCLAKDLKDAALARFNRLLIECLFPREISKRYNKSKKQRTTRVGVGLFRIEGIRGIYGKVKIAGKTNTTALGTDDPAEARQKHAEWTARLYKERKADHAKKGTLKSYQEPFLALKEMEVMAGNLKPDTITDLRLTFKHLEGHWPQFATLDISEMTGKETMVPLVKHLQTTAYNKTIKDPNRPKQGLSRATFNTYIAPLVQELRYLAEENIISHEKYYDLKKHLKFAKVKPRTIEMPTAEQLKIMRGRLYRVRQGNSLGECGPKFDVSMLSGARKETVNSIRGKDYDKVNRRVFLRHLKGHAGELTEKWVPICDELCKILERYIEGRKIGPEELLFKTRNNNNAFRNAAREAGIERWFHHACRDWFGTKALQETKDPVSTSELMCHTDGGITLLKTYRQVCNDHLQSVVRPLKLYPGANIDSSISATAQKVTKEIAIVGGLVETIALPALDRILWITDRARAGDIHAIQAIPALGQEVLPCYVPAHMRKLERPSSDLIKANFKYLVKLHGLFHSDIAAATGIPPSAVAKASKSGELQAMYVPILCKYLKVSAEEFLTCQLAEPASPEANQAEKTSTPPANLSPKESDPKPPKTIPEMLTEQDPSTLMATFARNLRSILLEKNLTPNGLATLAAIPSACMGRFLNERFLAREDTMEKIAGALKLNAAELLDPARDNIVPKSNHIISNLQAILTHHAIAAATYCSRLGLHVGLMEKAVETGLITAYQAHKIAAQENITVRELLTEDLASKFPPAPTIDPVIIARNLDSLCWEWGLYPCEIGNKAGVCSATALNYAKGKSQHIERGVLGKIAQAVGLTVAELADPARPVLQPTCFFKSNLLHLINESGLLPTPFSERVGLDHRALQSLLEGSDPNPHQVGRLCANLKLTPLELLTTDLRQDTQKEVHAGRDAPPVADARSDGQPPANAPGSTAAAENKP